MSEQEAKVDPSSAMDSAGVKIEIAGSDVLRRASGAVEAVVDDERILLSPRDFTYFGLTGTGAPVWDLVDGQRTFDDLVQKLEESFDADEEGLIRREAANFLEALIAAGLAEIAAD